MLALAGNAQAVEKASQQVSPFYGSFGYSIPIEVPPFHGLEPRLALAYSSEGRNGILGAGWSLAGFSTIQRANSGRGTPRFDASDIYLLDGQELVACVGGSVSPSCTSGGTHSTKIESYLKIRFDSPSNSWTVWGRDGTRTIFTPIIQVTAGTFRWGQTSVIDTKNNTVTYAWTCPGGDCYPSQIDYNGYRVTFFLEDRPDKLSAAAYSQLTQTQSRIRSIFVWLPAVSHIRAYKLTYTTSPLTGRSQLASVQQYGKNVTHDGAGLITGGTALPAVTFTYQNDALGKSFQGEPPNPPTPPNTVENVVWANRINAYAIAPGNSLQKSIGTNAWDAGGASTRAIASGDGYLEVTATGTGEKVVGLSNGDLGASYTEIDFGIYESYGSVYVFENGVGYGPLTTVVSGDRLRVEVQGNVVRYRKNGGAPFRTSTQTPVYPLLVDASIHTAYGVISSAVISGSLQDANFWCQGALLLTGDFSGDGRTDQLCFRSETQNTQVAKATATGFLAPATWLVNYAFNKPVVGDFNGDGKADIADGPNWQGDYQVILSTGSGFSPPAFWGNASGTGVDGEGNPLYGACSAAGTVPGAGDFNGDGITDVSCRVAGNGKIFIGLSNGVNGFAFSIFGNLSCEIYEQTGAIDFDGDGKDDWFCIGMTNHTLLVFPSTGSTFVWPAFGSLPGTFCDQPYYVLGDLNGDGRTDASCMQNGSVALSTGRSFLTQGTYGSWCAGSTNFFAADVDGDGASELVCNLSGSVYVRKWKGGTEGLGPVEIWKQNWCMTSVSGGDFSGDGKTDLLCNSQATPVALAGTGGFQADLVSSIANGLGGTIGATYSAATNYPNTNVTKQVVASVATNDGRSAAATTTYSYSDGRMEPKERRFLGFRYVSETPPCLPAESPCPYTETLLRQDLPSAGKVERVDRRAGTAYLSTQTYSYTTSPPGLFPATSLLTEERSDSYDSTGASRSTRTTHQYDAYGNRTQTVFYGETSPPGDETTVAWTFGYNPTSYIVARVATQRQFAGVGTTGTKLAERLFYYDNAISETVAPSQGYVTASLGWLDTEARHVRRNFGYDNWGNLTSVTDEDNRPPTTTTYDLTYRVFPDSVTNGAGEVERVTWDPICGVPNQRTDANNQITTMQSDDLCRLTRTDHLSTGGFEIRSYLSLGNPNAQHVRIETPLPGTLGNHYAKEYFDGLGRTYRTAKRGPTAADILQDRSYNARGRVASQSAPYYAGMATFATSYSYDGLDRLTVTRFPDNRQVSHTYPVWQETTTDEHGHATTTTFDAYGRRVLTEQKAVLPAIETHYSYDLLGRMTGMTDHIGNAWSWTFDSLGRNTQKTDPDSGTWSFTYFDSGLLRRQQDASAQLTDFTYDNAARLYTKTTPDETVTVDRSQPRSGYYNVGRVTTITANAPSSVRTLTIDYDALGRALKQVRTFGGQTYTAQKQYDAGGFLQTITYPVDNVVVGPMQYDAAGRLYAVPGFLNSVEYDAAGRPTVQQNANTTTTTRTYSPERGFLTGIATGGKPPAPTIQNLVYTPDGAGMVTQVTSPFSNESWTYGYDPLHRLTSASGAQSQTFTYDDIGRMTYNSLVGTYTYPLLGQPRPHAPATVNGSIMSYDLNGNLTSGRNRTIGWNLDRLPAWVTTAGGMTQFTYDGLGERLMKTTGSNTSIYPMGDDFEITNGVRTIYISVDGLGVVAKRVTTPGPPSTTNDYWLHTDRLGSIQAVTNASGVEVQRRTYRPYGEKITDIPTHTESRGWIDQRTDETGLTYLHARYYDPQLGILLSPDPLHPADPGVGTNRYSYLFGNPVNGADQSGLGPPCGVDVPPQYCNPSGWLPGSGPGWWDDSVCHDDGCDDRRGAREREPEDCYSNPSLCGVSPPPTAAPPPTTTTPECEGHKCKAHPPRASDFDKDGDGRLSDSEFKEYWDATGEWFRYHATLQMGTMGPPGAGLAGRFATRAASEALVYLGIRDGKAVYVGITNSLMNRQRQHGARFGLQAISGLMDRYSARSIEQALKIRNPSFENIRNSISPRNPLYREAVEWAEAWLTAHGW